jgi:hypothetical protein
MFREYERCYPLDQFSGWFLKWAQELLININFGVEAAKKESFLEVQVSTRSVIQIQELSTPK